MALKGKKPEAKEKRLKLFLYGPAGVGKTTAALQFPNSYVIDMEKGTDYYSESMNKSGSAVLQTVSAEDIKNEIRALLTEKHEYRTLIIDPITQLYNSLQDKWTRIFEKHSKSDASEIQDFGMRYWGRVKAEYKSIQRMLLSLDMNVIITSHQKDVYGAGMQKVGVGPDSMKGDSYVFDMVFRLDNINGKRIAFTEKERAEIGKNKFPESFEWSYANFTKFYGQDIIERVAAPVVMATKEQVAEVSHLLDVVKVDDTVISDWFTKADVETWDEMQGDKIQKCIDFIKKKIQTTEVK
jgi:GTPase SAR1 family protein